MPAAPLYYKPLIDASVMSTPLGKSTVGDVAATQLGFAYARAEDGTPQIAPLTKPAHELAASAAKDAVAATLTGISTLVAGRSGAKLGQVKLALDEAGYVANRTLTTMGNHPEWLDTADIEQASRVTSGIVEQVAKDSQHALAGYAGGTLDLGAPVTGALSKSWQGKQPVTIDEAAVVGYHVGREIEKSVTSTAPDSTSPLHWIDDATAEVLALWPGSVSRTAGALGIKGDGAKVEEIAGKWRAQSVTDSPNADANKSLHGLLVLAGVDATNPEHLPRARKLLQQADLEQVPATIAAGIVEFNRLDPARVEWVAARIHDVGARPGNVGGLAAEIDLLRRPPIPLAAPPPGD